MTVTAAAGGARSRTTGRPGVLVIDDNSHSADSLADLVRLLGGAVEVGYDSGAR
jgi:hypothetical protein